MQGCVGETPVSILLDTGCSGIVVRRDLVRDGQLTGEKQILVMINLFAITVPITTCKTFSPIFSGEVKVSFIDNPICGVIIGNVPWVHPDLMGDGELDKDDTHLCKNVTNDDWGPIKEKKN